MKFGNHENYCNGPGDCSCGEDRRSFASVAIKHYIEDPDPDDLQLEIKRLKAQVRYWKHKVKEDYDKTTKRRGYKNNN